MSLGDCTFSLAFTGNQDAPTPYDQGVVYAIDLSGSAIAQENPSVDGGISAIYAHEGNLTNSTLSLDLETTEDRFGVALGLSELVMLYVENKTFGNDGGVISLQPGASNGETNLLGASSSVKLRRGHAVCFFLADWAQSGWDVDSTHKTIDVVVSGGAAAIVVTLWGRRA